MIYAAIDIELRDHERASQAGAAAMGLWTWGMLWCKAKMSDGILPEAVVVRCPWVSSDSEARSLAESLCHSGLWEPVATGWRILRYTDKQESREQTETRLATDRARKRAARAKPVQQPATNPVPVRGVTELTEGPCVDSCPVSVRPDVQRTRDGRLEMRCDEMRCDDSCVVQDQTRVRESGPQLIEHPPRPLAPPLGPLPDPWREIAVGIQQAAGGAASFDIEDTWLRFQTADPPRPQTSDAWRKWCGMAPSFARKDRERAGSARRGPIRQAPDLTAPHVLEAKRICREAGHNV
jgi:hypothetical protein